MKLRQTNLGMEFLRINQDNGFLFGGSEQVDQVIRTPSDSVQIVNGTHVTQDPSLSMPRPTFLTCVAPTSGDITYILGGKETESDFGAYNQVG